MVHVASGTLALLIGFIVLLRKKGTLFHKKAGFWFAVLMVCIVVTGIVGVIIFKRNLFLLVITVLVGYNTYSGIRIVKIKSNVLYGRDILVMIAAVAITLYFLYYLQSIGLYWNPVIIYSTVDYLFAVILYDVGRYFIPKNRYQNLWVYEHSCKLISALGGLVSAFAGTILPQYKPYSQILPSLVMTLVMIFFVIKLYREHKQRNRSKNEIFVK
jgi:hypothetical protein